MHTHAHPATAQPQAFAPAPTVAAPYALLDEGAPAAAPPGARSRLYTGYRHQHRCDDPATLDATWAAAQADLAAGHHLVLLADYEWGVRLQGLALPPATAAQAPGALRLLVFSRLQRLDEAGVQAFLQQAEGPDPSRPPQPAGPAQPRAPLDAPSLPNPPSPPSPPAPAGVLDLQPTLDEAAFGAAIAAIQQAIAQGQTYQVNFTHRLHGRAWGDPVALYRRLRAAQAVGYGALIALPPAAPAAPGAPVAADPAGAADPAAAPGDAGPITHVLSRSPELFLQVDGHGTVTARPMKGTAARQPDAQADAAAAAALQADTKNRAENLMIVDLLRNDLGRVAQWGSVQVPALFALERYATVHQMTSTVQARLQPGIGLPALLRATFPCGSITGAPKHQTMRLIQQLEHTPRGLYCGAIGWVEAAAPAPAGRPAPALGPLCLSVPIRTLTLHAPQPDGSRPLRLGVGAGIVQDSVAAHEWDECRWKARFLTAMDPGLGLFETLRVVVAGGAAPPRKATACARADHLARLARSARALGLPFDPAAAEAALDAALADIAAQAAVAAITQPPATPTAGGQPAGPAPGASAWRLRLDLAADGRLHTRHAALAPLATDAQGRVRLGWAPTRLPDADPLAAHKTTRRAHYDAAVQAAEAAGRFDLLFVTADGRVAEGGRSTLFARFGAQWFTPPVADGALPGICRAQALQGGIDGLPVAERTLHAADLHAADALAVGNALRGVLAAVLDDTPPPNVTTEETPP